jgi:hypothetical protein
MWLVKEAAAKIKDGSFVPWKQNMIGQLKQKL